MNWKRIAVLAMGVLALGAGSAYATKVKKKDFDTGHKVCLDAQSGTIKVS
jgi:hypothetical protein